MERVALGPFRREFGALLEGETLEVAIGSGLNLPSYSPRVTRATGVDLSSEMLRKARERAEALGLPIDLRQADAEALPFDDASFDTVAISLALCTIPDPEKALRELSRVCRPTGRIVLLEHVRSTAGPLALAQRALSPLNERSIGCHLARETVDLARALGFTIDEERRRLFGAVRLVTMRPLAAQRVTLE
jgi:ubiquinone/menaquinone biosynthesis C-methylase UbiE